MQTLLEILYTNNLSKSYKEPVRYTSVALCAVGTSVTLHYLHPLRDSVCLLYKPFCLSLHISEEPLITLLPCLEYPVTVSLITLLPCLTLPCYHVSYYSVSCIPLLCLMYPITLLPCLPLPCYHVFHYPVSIKECKTTKKVDKLIIPRSHTPQNN